MSLPINGRLQGKNTVKYVVHSSQENVLKEVQKMSGSHCVSISVSRTLKIRQTLIQQADKMVQQIRQAFLDNLKSVTWMDDQTKRAAKIKVGHLRT